MGWETDRKNRKIANQGKKEVIITVTVADSFSDLDLVVEAFELAGADWVEISREAVFLFELQTRGAK